MGHREDFVRKNWGYALRASQIFGINPVVILAQAAHESAGNDGNGNWLWGNSYSARVRKNLFGITAGGSPNAYWNGDSSPSTANPHLTFRIYSSIENSILDFARLIKSKYYTAFLQSYNVPKYANLIAYSKYIDKKNGDDPVVYESSIIKNAAFIQKYVKDNGLPTEIPSPSSGKKGTNMALIVGLSAAFTTLSAAGIWLYFGENVKK